MDAKRRIAVVAATISVALGTGHLMQSGVPFTGAKQELQPSRPTDITPVSATLVPRPAELPARAVPAVVDSETAAPLQSDEPAAVFGPGDAVARPGPVVSEPPLQAEPGPVPATTTAELLPKEPATFVATLDPIAEPSPSLWIAKPLAQTGATRIDTVRAPQLQPEPEGATAILSALDPMVDPVPLPDVSQARTDSALDCPVTLDVSVASDAMLSIALLAPCHAGERIVLRHGKLAVTEKASVAGSLATSLPGLDKQGIVSVIFADGTRIEASAALPSLLRVRRFAVQWQADDAFDVNAFEGGAGFGTPGHIWADNRVQSNPIAKTGGFLTLLGDASVERPMLAEIYTFPTDATLSVTVTIEATVTQDNCNREVLAEMLLSEGGTVTATDLNIAMPGCEAVGDVLVLNNPVTDLKLAATE